MISVEKRDGKLVPFDSNKIREAVEGAMNEVHYTDTSLPFKVASIVEKEVTQDISVEEIQDLVVEALRKYSPEVAVSYESYRVQRTNKRNSKARKVYYEIMGTEVTSVTRDNANMNADTPAGMMMKFASETSKPFASNDLLSEEARIAHDIGDIHVHDEDYYPTKSLTCVQHPLDKILKRGFRAGHGASRPAKRIETASILGCISLETCQNEMHGGQAIPAFDFYLAPYVPKTLEEELESLADLTGRDIEEFHQYIGEHPIKDYIKKDLMVMADVERCVQHAINKTVDRVHQAMEAFIHNMNTIHSRGGNQVVFSSINYGTDTSPEGRCIIREILNSTLDGVGNHETAIFPIQIWKKKRGVNYLPSDPNYDLYKLACKVTAKRFFPNFINLDAPFNRHEKWRADDPERYRYECATMGCRTRVFEDMFGEKTSIGRGNLSFTSINLPRLGIKVMNIKDKQERISKLKSSLEDMCDLVARQLIKRAEFQSTALAKQFPLLMSSLWQGGDKLKPTDTIKDVIKHGTLAIGFIGLAECLVAVLGKHHGESEEAQKLGVELISIMKSKCEEYKKEYKWNFGVLATPAEGLSGRFTKLDKKRYGIIPGVTDRKYYTNSNHVPVYYKCTAEHKAKIEAPYHTLTLGGHIFYTEFDGDATKNPTAVMKVVDLMDKYDLGYGSINHVQNRCLHCGREWEERHATKCRYCGSEEIDTVERITGYLVGSKDRWGEAKIAESNDRETHGI